MIFIVHIIELDIFFVFFHINRRCRNIFEMSKERKLKICHVITRMIVGGAQENTLLTIKGHLEKGHQCVLVTGPSPGREGELLTRMNMPPFRIEVMDELVREISPKCDLAAYFSLKRFFEEEDFDVVHTHSSKAGIIGRWAARAAGVPVVVHTVHGQAFYPYQVFWKNMLYILLERMAAKKCDRIFAVADAMIDQCVEAGVAPANMYKTVYSGMDTAAFASAHRYRELRDRLNIPESARVISTVARLFPQKGYEYVLPAARKIIREFPDTIFLIVGDGPLFRSLKEEISEMSLSQNFRFAGLVSPEAVKHYLAQSDLLWHLSLREGLPRSVVQALACGIPAIGFRLDGTPEVILNGETGFVTTPEAVDEVVEATRKLWNDPVLRQKMGRRGRELVLERFDWHQMSEILEAEYFDIFSKKSLN